MKDLPDCSPIIAPIASLRGSGAVFSVVSASSGPSAGSGHSVAAVGVPAELRARLAAGCAGLDDGDRSGDGGVRGAVDAAVGSLRSAAPLVDSALARSAGDDDLVWCAQAIQQAVNVLEGARTTVTAEVAHRWLNAKRGEACAGETLTNATGLSGTVARRVERDALMLQARPQIAATLGRGDINSDQAVVVAAADRGMLV